MRANKKWGLLSLVSLGVFLSGMARRRAGEPKSLRVRQITVVDEDGVERVWIGAPVPDPIVQGSRQKRKGPLSGIILLDAKGNERSGYVTSDLSGEVFMSLDSEKAQEVLFYINPEGGAHLSIYDSDGNLGRFGVLEGHPKLLLRDRGETILEHPEEDRKRESSR